MAKDTISIGFEDKIWQAADVLRGNLNASEYEGVVLGLIFLKYISDRFETKYAELIHDPLADPEDKDEYTSENVFFVPKGARWSVISQDAHNATIGVTIDNALRLIEQENPRLKGILPKNFARPELDKRRLGDVVDLFTNVQMHDAGEERDLLGRTYEYCLQQFASQEGKKAGEFYTPQMISTILSRIVTLDCQDPSTGKKKRIDKVLDFACGSGSLLLNVRREMKDYAIGKIYGQEKNITTYNLARMNMLLHGVKDTEFEIHHGDSLANDWDILNEQNPAKKMQFDAVVANPPFSLRWDPTEETAKDFRFSRYGVAPKSAADFAFLLHGFHFLSDNGTMAIILPHGVLFRGGKEEVIRKKLLEDDNIDAVIGLPANLFYSTGIPVCILVLKKCRKNDKILFINASGEEHYEKGKRQNYLRDKDVEKIVETYQFRKEEPRFSRLVSLAEIKENDYNLNITRYVNLSKDEEQIDLEAVTKQLKETDAKIEESRGKLNVFLKELGLQEL